MRSLYVRIWLTVVAALALFALVAGWLLQNQLERERQQHGHHREVDAEIEIADGHGRPTGGPVEGIDQAASASCLRANT